MALLAFCYNFQKYRSLFICLSWKWPLALWRQYSPVSVSIPRLSDVKFVIYNPKFRKRRHFHLNFRLIWGQSFWKILGTWSCEDTEWSNLWGFQPFFGCFYNHLEHTNKGLGKFNRLRTLSKNVQWNFRANITQTVRLYHGLKVGAIYGTICNVKDCTTDSLMSVIADIGPILYRKDPISLENPDIGYMLIKCSISIPTCVP
jgi:hypothetical protein